MTRLTGGGAGVGAGVAGAGADTVVGVAGVVGVADVAVVADAGIATAAAALVQIRGITRIQRSLNHGCISYCTVEAAPAVPHVENL